MSSPTSAAAKTVATVALLNLDAGSATLLRECFRQFGIETADLAASDGDKLRKQKYEGLVLPLEDGAEAVLETCRSSPSNKHIVLYGIADSLGDAMKFSRYGINAVLDRPVDRQAVLRAVRATHLLVLHELRRYVRIPVVAQVKVQTERKTLSAVSGEISAGGMSLNCGSRLEIGDSVQLSFDLPNAPGVLVRAAVCWARAGDDMTGFRFDPEDERRVRVKEWIDGYLDL